MDLITRKVEYSELQDKCINAGVEEAESTIEAHAIYYACQAIMLILHWTVLKTPNRIP